MKISKLFHWLYAFLMLLPVGAVLGTTLYTIFNPNAKDSYSGSESYSYDIVSSSFTTNTPYTYDEYEDVYTFDDSLVFEDNVYLLSIDSSLRYYLNNYISSSTLYSSFGLYVVGTTRTIVYNLPQGSIVQSLRINADTYTDYILTYKYDSNYQYFYAMSNGSFPISKVPLSGQSSFIVDIFVYVFDKTMFLSSPLVDYLTDYGEALASVPDYYMPLNVEEVTSESSTLDNAFYYALDSVNTNPLFSWASASFLVQPFHYIGNLFGLPITSPINTLLSYWLDVSIIWLVFDVVMYVPLLVHRWLDKGGIE